MGKAIWKPGTVLYPVPVVMVSCGTEENANIITVAWTGTINSDPAMTYVSIRPSRHSFELIKNSKEFVINLVTKDLTYACDFCGVKSGRDMDKFKEMKLTAKKGEKVDAPIIYESPVNIECKVKEIIPLGTHHMFLAEVVSVSVSDEYLDETGKFHFNDAEPVCYSHGAYFTLGEQLGTFGYSVKKPKKTSK
ncbi:MAG: flavin reductase family protein [Anaerotignum sp.]|nr:flavin reductase family protein [Anaerotignum sp.]